MPVTIAFPPFPNVTQLDPTGPAQVPSQLGSARRELVWHTREPVPTDAGFSMTALSWGGTMRALAVRRGFS